MAWKGKPLMCRNNKIPEWAKHLLWSQAETLWKVSTIMATLQEALDGWKAYTADLKAQLDAAVSGLDAANTAAATAAQALADFQANDAETDASQLAAQAQADADAVQAALDEVKTPVEPPPVIGEPVV